MNPRLNEPPPHAARNVPGMERSPPEHPHHAPHLRHHAHAGPIPPAARHGTAASHKERARHAHDAFWRRAKTR